MKTLKLEKQSDSKKTRHALAAANIRRELKFNFPNTKFRVTSSSYSGGSSVDVRWTNGETPKAIDSIINKYQYGRFDGMIDMYENTKDFSDEYGEAKYIFSKREYSHAAYVDAVENAVLFEGEELGLYYNDDIAVGFDTIQIDASERAYNAMRERDYITDPIGAGKTRSYTVSPSQFDSTGEFDTVDVSLFVDGILTAHVNCISKDEAKQIGINHENE